MPALGAPSRALDPLLPTGRARGGAVQKQRRSSQGSAPTASPPGPAAPPERLTLIGPYIPAPGAMPPLFATAVRDLRPVLWPARPFATPLLPPSLAADDAAMPSAPAPAVSKTLEPAGSLPAATPAKELVAAEQLRVLDMERFFVKTGAAAASAPASPLATKAPVPAPGTPPPSSSARTISLPVGWHAVPALSDGSAAAAALLAGDEGESTAGDVGDGASRGEEGGVGGGGESGSTADDTAPAASDGEGTARESGL